MGEYYWLEQRVEIYHQAPQNNLRSIRRECLVHGAPWQGVLEKLAQDLHPIIQGSKALSQRIQALACHCPKRDNSVHTPLHLKQPLGSNMSQELHQLQKLETATYFRNLLNQASICENTTTCGPLKDVVTCLLVTRGTITSLIDSQLDGSQQAFLVLSFLRKSFEKPYQAGFQLEIPVDKFAEFFIQDVFDQLIMDYTCDLYLDVTQEELLKDKIGFFVEATCQDDYKKVKEALESRVKIVVKGEIPKEEEKKETPDKSKTEESQEVKDKTENNDQTTENKTAGQENICNGAKAEASTSTSERSEAYMIVDDDSGELKHVLQDLVDNNNEADLVDSMAAGTMWEIIHDEDDEDEEEDIDLKEEVNFQIALNQSLAEHAVHAVSERGEEFVRPANPEPNSSPVLDLGEEVSETFTIQMQGAELIPPSREPPDTTQASDDSGVGSDEINVEETFQINSTTVEDTLHLSVNQAEPLPLPAVYARSKSVPGRLEGRTSSNPASPSPPGILSLQRYNSTVDDMDDKLDNLEEQIVSLKLQVYQKLLNSDQQVQ